MRVGVGLHKPEPGGKGCGGGGGGLGGIIPKGPEAAAAAATVEVDHDRCAPSLSRTCGTCSSGKPLARQGHALGWAGAAAAT